MPKIFGQLEDVQLELLSADPTGKTGRVFFDRVTFNFRYYNGSAWKTVLAGDFSNATGTLPISRGGTGQVTATAAYTALSPLTTKGDVQTYSTLPVRLGVGADGTVLTADSTAATGLKWGASAVVPVAGGLVYSNGASLVSIPGTSGGIPYFSAANVPSSSVALTLNGVVLGGGVGGSPAATAAGAANQVLRIPGAGGAPAFGAVDLAQAAAVTGILPTANGGTGQNSTATFPTSGVVVTEAAAETLTNKTISGASNTITNVSLTTGVTGTLPIANGGTSATTKAGAFDSLSPMAIAGDIIYGGASGTGTRLAAGTATQVLHGGTTPVWGSVSLTADVSGILPAANGGTGVISTATFPTSGVVVTETAAETLTNKTLTAPVIATIVNTGTLTLPTSTDTLVARSTTDTLENKVYRASNGTVGAPSHSFTSDTTTGWRLNGAGGLSASAAGAEQLLISSGSVEARNTARFLGIDGAVGSPSYGFANDSNTGWYQGASALDTMSAAVGGLKRLEVNTSGIIVTGTVATTGVVGLTTAATAGNVGEFKETTIVTAVSLTNGQYNDAANGTTGLVLTAGVWDISGNCRFVPAATTVVTNLILGPGTETGNNGTGLDTKNQVYIKYPAGYVPTDEVDIVLPVWRVVLAGSQTYFLKAQGSFSVSTLAAQGYLRATRVN